MPDDRAKMLKGWSVHTDGDFRHVWPNGDIREHDTTHEFQNGTLTLHCWCEPTLEHGLVMHHSMDRRETVEHLPAATQGTQGLGNGPPETESEYIERRRRLRV